ncbi:MAG: universal stress protein [Candidatus Sericytochromatia bacterium]
MITKILFPFDGSDESKKPFNHVLEIAKKFSASVLLVHAYENPKRVGIIAGEHGIDADFIENTEENLISNGQYLINEIKDEIRQHNIKVETALAKGDTGHAIVEIAEAEECDLIIMCGKNSGIFERFFIGTISDYVVNNTKIPTLLIH